jgi:cardiolipin synthase A/B
VRFLDKPYEHAKAAIADGTLVYVGSINYTAGSMDKNREVGVMTMQPDIAKQLETEFRSFWDLATR